MLTKKRMAKIMEMVRKDVYVSVKDLTEVLQTSRSSVVRDLMELESQGLIKRERGGASLVNASILTPFNEPAVYSKTNIHEEEKRRICAKASQMVQDGDCIYIDSGTTAMYLMEYVYDKKITVVTPNTYLLSKIPEDFQGKLFLVGGEVSLKNGTTKGPLTEAVLGQFYFDTAFLTANGISIGRNEAYVFDFEIGAVKKEVLKRSAKSCLLIDRSKFDVKAICTWAKLEEFHTIYVDEVPEEEKSPDNVVNCEREEIL
ncbi:MAG: DeoR/GlpR transcriptional regulator [Erysipelotrichaceae bacterium]|nr:DeoR/GlpR transcriptional regulator [Erysipelotrichaceae bacterium]